MTTTETELYYLSHDGTTQIRALLWEPDATTPPQGMIQIAHGMAEHIERYRDFARFLADHGFIVCANDHLGHGKSVSSSDDWGNLPVKGGKDILIEDTHRLRILIAERFSTELPYVLFGHSMGSFIARSYCAHHGEGLAAAIFCGTGQQPLWLSRAGGMLAKLISSIKSATHKSTFLNNMGAGAYSKAVDKPRTPLDWLSFDEGNVDAYIADPASGFLFSAGGYATLLSLTAEIVTPACARAIPQDLPILFIAGAEDPVGTNGKGVEAAAEQLRKTGHTNVTVRLYEGMRHEILNETGHAKVYQDVLDWIVSSLL
jgi:alpha-beta hydrolase superfamily lysophospholipase